MTNDKTNRIIHEYLGKRCGHDESFCRIGECIPDYCSNRHLGDLREAELKFIEERGGKFYGDILMEKLSEAFDHELSDDECHAAIITAPASTRAQAIAGEIGKEKI
jgi:hypothetical protein